MNNSQKSPATFRAPDITKNQLADLGKRWGENQSQVIIRCIERVWLQEMEQSESQEQSEKGSLKPSLPKPYFSSTNIALYKGNAEKILSAMESESVDCIVTSPPYYGLRDYEVDEQLGLEYHPQLYIDKLVNVFQEAQRVLKPTGSLWVNIGDTYWSGKGRAHGKDTKQKHRRFDRPQDRTGVAPWCVPKQRLLIPHRFAIAMQSIGWIIRNDNVWYKPSPTPDPVADRCSTAHEYVFHFVQKRRYYFDAKAVAVPSNEPNKTKPPHSVWIIDASSSAKNHKAVFPEQLIALPIKATCPPNGVLLDPFCGSGTTLAFAIKLGEGRRAIGIDIDRKALKEARRLLSS